MQMPGRSLNTATYRYGFNGKEKDDEVKGEGNQQDYGMRIYDPRVGRFLSVDPITKDYPELTPYQFASNTPIQAIDLDGKEKEVIIYQAANDGSLTQLQLINNSTLKNGHGPLGNGVYTITYNANKNSYNEAYVSSKGDAVNSFASLNVNISEWNPNDRLQARIIVESVKVGLEKLGFKKEDVDKDVNFVDLQNEALKTKYARVYNSQKYTKGWDKAIDSRSKTQTGAESKEVDKTGYSLKYYKDRGDVIGFIKSNIFKHINEFLHEVIEPAVGKDYNKMHESNSNDFLYKETTRNKNH